MDGMRQPVHVVYGGAHLFKSDSVRKLGKLAERALADFDAWLRAESVALDGDGAAPAAVVAEA